MTTLLILSAITNSYASENSVVQNSIDSPEMANYITTIKDQVAIEIDISSRTTYRPNELAYTRYDGHVYTISYNPNMMYDIRDRIGENAIFFIIAHELGHIMNHDLEPVRRLQREDELQADRYATYVMYQLGVEWDQLEEALEVIKYKPVSNTHPPFSDRYREIAREWNYRRRDDTCQGRFLHQGNECVPCGERGQPPCNESSGFIPCSMGLREHWGICSPACGLDGEPTCADGCQGTLNIIDGRCCGVTNITSGVATARTLPGGIDGNRYSNAYEVARCPSTHPVAIRCDIDYNSTSNSGRCELKGILPGRRGCKVLAHSPGNSMLATRRSASCSVTATCISAACE